MVRGKLLATTAAIALFGISLSAFGYGEIKDYQLGSEWGKKRVWNSNLEGKRFAFVRAAQATAYITVGATGFYLGKFAGVHVLATNHHVCPSAQDCVGQSAQFRLLGIKTKITKFLITLKNLDLTLLEIDVNSTVEASALAKVARNFAFRQQVYQNEPLMTFGFGVAGNPQNYLVGNEDADCKVFSKTGEFRLTADPDRFNPVGYKAWSFVHACDISHGDSGSAVVDRRNGAIVGILWTGKFPKPKRAQDSTYLDQLLQASSPAMWSELNFAVPSTMIGKLLENALYESSVNSYTKNVLAAMLGSN